MEGNGMFMICIINRGIIIYMGNCTLITMHLLDIKTIFGHDSLTVWDVFGNRPIN